MTATASSRIARPRRGERRQIELTLRQLVFEDSGHIQDIREQALYSGEAALDTTVGTVLIDGAHRIIRSELGPCVGFAPFARGWRCGNIWGDCMEFVPVAQGVQVRVQLAEDSLASAWSRQTVARLGQGRTKVTVAEPKVSRALAPRTSAELPTIA